MEFKETNFAGAWIATPKVFRDPRGFFLESYSKKAFAEIGLDTVEFVQDNHSFSRARGVLRGLHFQLPPYAQAKIVRVTRGAIFDVIVDVRKHSPTFGAWQGFELSCENFAMIVVPKGFAHGFCTLTEDAEVQYKVDVPYTPSHDSGIRWNDPDIGVRWPVADPLLSEKDRALPLLRDFVSPF